MAFGERTMFDKWTIRGDGRRSVTIKLREVCAIVSSFSVKIKLNYFITQSTCGTHLTLFDRIDYSDGGSKVDSGILRSSSVS